ncbi:MAG TPA: patatin-like phospholipase family protein, partial [Gemmataceae bacterium]|nr:patatin-like phospholipase family protein [Gemmataceae bacterium]
AVGIVLLLNVWVFGHVLLTAFPPLAVSGDFFLLCLFTLIILAGRAYKFRFPNMPSRTAPVDLTEKYKQLADIEARVVAGTLTRAGAADELAAAAGGVPTLRQVFSHDIHYPNPKAWTGPKPPIAIVCASGGGSRAAAWTMKVLLDLEERFLNPNPEGRVGKDRRPVAFPYHVRLVSGASGGMIGASYYVATLAEPPGGAAAVARNPIFRPGRVDRDPPSHEELFADVCRDFLTPATHTLVNHDFLSLFLPFRVDYDRGQALEDAFKIAFHGQLHVPFSQLRDGEAAGWRPSLIFTPMLVEDGRQLFISNLGLRSVTQNRAFVLGESDMEAPTDPAGFALLSREGVEFFKLFPEATEFTVATAARMSASFPYVMPAVSLPTNPPRRVVDAGYYDNFGVGIVASWLFNHMDWIRENTSGVVIVQIRDGVSESGRKREEVPDSFPPLAERGLHWLTTPPAGLWSSRMAANAFRNDNLLHLLNDFFAANGFPRGFFATVAFELSVGDDVALNFTLSETEIAAIRAAIERDAYTLRAESLVNWWHARLATPTEPLSLDEVDLPDIPDVSDLHDV